MLLICSVVVDCHATDTEGTVGTGGRAYAIMVFLGIVMPAWRSLRGYIGIAAFSDKAAEVTHVTHRIAGVFGDRTSSSRIKIGPRFLR